MALSPVGGTVFAGLSERVLGLLIKSISLVSILKNCCKFKFKQKPPDMKQTINRKPDCSIYPGEYVPFLSEKDIKEAINLTDKKDIVQPAVNITEQHHSYKVEVVIPGVKRDELLIYAKGNILSICAVNNEKINSTLRGQQVQEFSYKWFDRHVLLPEDADSTFISAEYRSGIVVLHIPKATRAVNNSHTRIIVY